MHNPIIYLDNAATTQLHPDALAAMMPYLTSEYGNPSAVCTLAKSPRRAIETARMQVAAAVGAIPEQIFFTAGGTEADNWAIKGVAEAYRGKGNHIITSSIEHHALLHTCDSLSKQGFDVTYLPVNREGFVDMDVLRQAVRHDTILISVMAANNEIGTIQPISAIGTFARERGILFHTDAVQAIGHIPIDVNGMNIDLLSMSAHKFYGPKGIGALYISSNVRIGSFIHGGAQESKRRAGTENVAGIVGMGKAVSISVSEMPDELTRVTALRNELIKDVLNAIPHTRLNGPTPSADDNRLPGNANFSFAFVEGESLLTLLDLQGCCASSGSACSSGSLDPSHVLMALGNTHEEAQGSVRFSLGRYNTKADIYILLSKLPSIVAKLRDMSPLYEDYLLMKGGVK